VNWLLGAYRSSWGSCWGPVESTWGLIINSRTHLLAPASGALVEGPRGVRVRFGGVQGVVSIGRAPLPCLTHQVSLFEDILTPL
jgi:hypothetical protein